MRRSCEGSSTWATSSIFGQYMALKGPNATVTRTGCRVCGVLSPRRSQVELRCKRRRERTYPERFCDGRPSAVRSGGCDRDLGGSRLGEREALHTARFNGRPTELPNRWRTKNLFVKETGASSGRPSVSLVVLRSFRVGRRLVSDLGLQSRSERVRERTQADPSECVMPRILLLLAERCERPKRRACCNLF